MCIITFSSRGDKYRLITQRNVFTSEDYKSYFQISSRSPHRLYNSCNNQQYNFMVFTQTLFLHTVCVINVCSCCSRQVKFQFYCDKTGNHIHMCALWWIGISWLVHKNYVPCAEQKDHRVHYSTTRRVRVISVESVVKLVGKLVMFPLVGFSHRLRDSAHGGPAERERERGRKRESEASKSINQRKYQAEEI